MKLYIFEHCPFCVKARMPFGIRGIPIELIYLLNDDAQTPKSLVGRKVVPILQKDDGACMPESMDIVHYSEKHSDKPLFVGQLNPAISHWLAEVNSYINKLLMPRFVMIDFPEFATPASKAFYTTNKEAYIGSFKDNLANTKALIERINADLNILDPLIKSPAACNGKLSEDDIHLFAQLRGLSIVKGVTYPKQVNAYRKTMAQRCDIPNFDDISI